jgi:hypothetical protein
MNRKRVRKGKGFFSPDDVGNTVHTPADIDMSKKGVYEMEDTSILFISNEMADTSVRAEDSEDESSSDEDLVD